MSSVRIRKRLLLTLNDHRRIWKPGTPTRTAAPLFESSSFWVNYGGLAARGALSYILLYRESYRCSGLSVLERGCEGGSAAPQCVQTRSVVVHAKYSFVQTSRMGHPPNYVDDPQRLPAVAKDPAGKPVATDPRRKISRVRKPDMSSVCSRKRLPLGRKNDELCCLFRKLGMHEVFSRKWLPLGPSNDGHCCLFREPGMPSVRP
jgi:hypothetical protein